MGVVYVLSLPSFHWEKQNYSPVFGRSRHTCSLAGSRQMIVVGGQIATADSRLAVDPWPQGIGVFDLSAMQCKWLIIRQAALAGFWLPYIYSRDVTC